MSAFSLSKASSIFLHQNADPCMSDAIINFIGYLFRLCYGNADDQQGVLYWACLLTDILVYIVFAVNTQFRTLLFRKTDALVFSHRISVTGEENYLVEFAVLIKEQEAFSRTLIVVVGEYVIKKYRNLISCHHV